MMSIYNYFKKEKFEENNVKLEVIEDKENSYVVRFDKEKAIATLKLKMPDSTRHYYTHYNEHNNFRYDWYDEEYHTGSEIAEQLNIMLDRFLKERENVSISTNKLLS